MPKVKPDTSLLQAIERLVHDAGGNESEAARMIGVSRLKINRIRKQLGATTPAIQNDLWKRLEQISSGVQNPLNNDTNDTTPIQIVRDIPSVALQVLRYMTDAIEREIRIEGKAHGK